MSVAMVEKPSWLRSFSNPTQLFRPIPDRRHMQDPGHRTMIIVICNCILHNINDHSASRYLPPSPWESRFRVPTVSNWLKVRRGRLILQFSSLGAYLSNLDLVVIYAHMEQNRH